MKVLPKVLALCLTMLLMIPPLYASADEAPEAGDAYYRIQNTWKGFYLYEGADGKVSYGYTSVDDASAQWAIETTGDGHKRVRNRATGHYLNGQNTTAEEITKPLESSATESGWTSDIWDIADVDGKPGEVNFIRADHPNWILNVQILDGYAQGNDWAQKPWGSATWRLEAAETSEPVRIVLPWKGTYLYEDGGKVKYGTPALNDQASHWYIEDKNGHKTIRNRATGRYMNAQSVTPEQITNALDSSAIEEGWTSDLWDIEPAADGSGGINIVSVDYPNWIVNVQIEDGYAQSNDWAQKSWGSAVWKLEPAADTTPVRMMDSWKGSYLYEDSGQVKYGQPDWQDKASHWIVEDSAEGSRLRNLATGNYVSSVDYVGATPLVTVESPSADAAWKVETARDGDGNPVDGFVTLQSASPGHDNSYINVQNQDGFAQGNNWAQKTWGSAHWKLAAPTAPSTGPEEPESAPYIRMKNNWLQLYLYESDGIVKYGNVTAGDPNAEWLIETAGSVKRIKNRGTGHYVNLDGVSDARAALKASPLADGATAGDWVIEDFQGYKEIRSAGDNSGSYINVENKLKHAQYGVVPREWGSPKWEFVEVQDEAPSYVRLKNSYRGTYLYESDGKVIYGSPNVDDVASHWSLVPGAQGTLIVNRATGHRMTVEHVSSYEDALESLDIDPTWASAQWTVEDAGSSNKVFRNVWKNEWLIHVEDEKGFAQASSIPADWGSAQWVVEDAPDVAPVLPSGYIRIANKATGQYLYENGSNVVLYGTPAENDASSHWTIRSEGDAQLLENRATGNVMSIEHAKSYLETTVNPSSGDLMKQWAIENGPAANTYLIRSMAPGYEDAYVHSEDGQGYAQVELRSVESGGVQWKFEAAPAEAIVVPPEEGPANAVTPVQNEFNAVRIHAGDTANVLVENEDGSVVFSLAGESDLNADWLPQDYNGHKRFVNRWSGHYLSLNSGAASVSEDGSGLSSQWNVEAVVGYVTLENADIGGGYLTSPSGSRLRFEKVLADTRYEGEHAFVYGGASSLASEGVASGFGTTGAGALFAVNAEQAGSYDVAVRYQSEVEDDRDLSIYVNGLKLPDMAAFPSTGDERADVTLTLTLRGGMNTIALQADADNSGSGLAIDAITVRGSANREYRGATLPFVTYEAEHGETNGTVIGPDRTFKNFASEASGRRAVTLDATGQYVSFTTTKASNALNIRYIIPDAPTGGGTDATLTLYVDGVNRGKVSLTSKYGWVYGKYPWSNDPAEGDAHRFYDETHLLIGDVPAGATIKLQKDGDDTAAYYVVDFVELEQVEGAYSKPSGYLSVTDYGAVANDAGDDTNAFNAAIAAAKSAHKGVWIPSGRFELTSPLHVDHIVIRGAGMWHTTVHGAGFMVNGSQVKVYDLLLDVGVTARHDELREAGFDGTFGLGSVIQNVWIEHAKAGIWSMRSESGVSTNGLYVGGVRIRNTYADGINFSTGTSNSMIEQTHIRNSGDDSIALWSQTMDGVSDADSSTKGNTVRFNTVQLPWLADNVAIFGGRDNKVQDNVLSDTVGFGAGIAVSTRFDPVAFQGRTTVERNTLIRTGGREPNWGQDFGAIWLFTGDKPIDADIVIRNNTALDSTYQGLYISGPYAIANTTHKVLIQNLVIDGTGTWGVHVFNGVSGSVDMDNVIVRNTKVGLAFNPTGASFELRTVDPQPAAADGDFFSDVDPEAGRSNPDPNPDTDPIPPDTSVPPVVVTPPANEDSQLSGAIAAGKDQVVVAMKEAAGASSATFSFGTLREAANKLPNATIVLQAGDFSYSLPANILEVLADANGSLGLSGEGKLTVTVSQVGNEAAQEARAKAEAAGFSLEGTPISFELTLVVDGNQTTIHSFGGHFIARTFAVEGEVDASHAAVVVFDPATGTFRTVPALFETKNGKTLVTVNSTTNSLYAVAVSNRTFTDLAGHWAQSDITLMANKQVVNGYTPRSFAPDRDISRAEFAAMLVRALGLDTTQAGAAKFTDVQAGAWYADFVASAAQYGIVTGLSDGTFCPNVTITRAEMAVMLARAAKLASKKPQTSADLEAKFPQDYARIGKWASEAVALVAGSGIMEGRGAHTFAPEGAATRAEAAVVLKRLLQSAGLMNQ